VQLIAALIRHVQYVELVASFSEPKMSCITTYTCCIAKGFKIMQLVLVQIFKISYYFLGISSNTKPSFR